MPTYRIQVYTGDVDGAGTDANVFLTIYGWSGSSDEVQLDTAGDDFERNSVGTYSFDLKELGDLRMVHVRHDNSGSRPGWWLQEITIRNEETDQEWSFPCNRWLARDEDDRQIHRYLDRA